MTYSQLFAGVASVVALVAAPAAMANRLHADMLLATPDGAGAPIGSVTIIDSVDGARISVDLHGLPPGAHGFHVHVNPACGPGSVDGQTVPAGAAGPHFDPEHNGAHMGPMNFGHLGDLPVLTVAADGTDHQTLVAPRIHDVLGLKNHSLIIHADGDNYSDSPRPLGGGGPRIACGVLS
jgi:Cu-Zn family superoxide dismutase